MSGGVCALHGQEVPHLEKHHLIPNNRKSAVILVCSACAKQVHLLFSNRELKNEYNTLEKLLASPRVHKWIAWIRKRKDLSVCMKTKK